MALYAFDGTWREDEDDDRKDSNVVKFRDAYNGNKFYLEGVGTRLGAIGKVFGATKGMGGRMRIEEAERELNRNFSRGDREIDIVGFSRGAALALHFANEIYEDFDRAPIRFLGLFDTVASFGIPGNDVNLGWAFTLTDNVKKCYHALALDERRGNFPLTRLKSRGLPLDDRAQEVWFRGVHSDIGGGNDGAGLSSIPLCWLLRRARESGLPLDEARYQDHFALCKAESEIGKNFDPIADPARIVSAGDFVHASVSARGKWGKTIHNDPPANVAVVSS